MRSIARILELSVAGNYHENFRNQRRAEIGELPKSLKKAIATAIDQAVVAYPEKSEAALGMLARRLIGMDYLGQGTDFTVYGNQSDVVKVHRRSALWSNEDRLDFAAKEQAATDLLCQEMGGMAVNQRYEVGDHPFGGHQVVLARQAHVPGPAIALFTHDKPTINRPIVDAYCSDVENGYFSLLKVVDATHALYDAAGLVPDVNGPGNLVLTGPKLDLAILDPQPLDRLVHTPVVDMIRRQVDDLAGHLAAV